MDIFIELCNTTTSMKTLFSVINSYQPIDYYILHMDHSFGTKWVVSGSQTFRNNVPHSYNDQPYIIEDGSYWYKNGLLHRIDKPAIIKGDFTAYYLNNTPHNDKGPALIFPNGSVSYYKHGLFIGVG